MPIYNEIFCSFRKEKEKEEKYIKYLETRGYRIIKYKEKNVVS
jgi:hypothetical protein